MCEKAVYLENCPKCGTANDSSTHLRPCQTAIDLKIKKGCLDAESVYYKETTHLCETCVTVEEDAKKEKGKKPSSTAKQDPKIEDDKKPTETKSHKKKSHKKK